jgi:aspartate/methionine/tyrosine aminotransferase
MSPHGGVIHIGSFSKSIAPALRVGFIVAPWEMMSRMLALKTDAGSGALEQMVLAEYCAPHFSTHVPKLTRGLRAKLDTLMEALNEQFGTAAEFEDPKGGIFLWVKLPDNVDTLKLYQAALARRCRHQSRTGMVDRQGLCRQPAAAVLCQPLAGADPRGRRRARRGVPQGIWRAGAKRECGAAGAELSAA